MSASPLMLGSTVTIYNLECIQRRMPELEGQHNEPVRRMYRKMLEAGAERFLCKPADADCLLPLRHDCPNFSSVIEDLLDHLTLAVSHKRGIHLMPILLAGDPGVGKTHFAKSLATVLGVPFQFVSMGTMTAGWILSGSAPTWSGARQGKVAEGLIESHFANPLYLLDELDKTGGDARYDPFGALLQLLEGDTAAHFKDEFLDLEIDASYVLWVATANDLSRIPGYILSRMVVYEVPPPTPEQSALIAQRIYDNLREQSTWPFQEVLEDDVLNYVAGIAPRDMKKRLTEAMARATRQKREKLCVSDFKPLSTNKGRRIGFLD